MRASFGRTAGLAAVVAALGVMPASAAAQSEAFSTFEWRKNMHPLGVSESPSRWSTRRRAPGSTTPISRSGVAPVYQGSYQGFRIIDVADPENPQEIFDYNDCSPGTTQGNQGDVIVWENLLVRSWNSPATATSSCDGDLVGAESTRTTARRSAPFA
jgi:hypothetical protein